MSPHLETVACALCGSTRAQAVLRARDIEFGGDEYFDLVCCDRCGLRYLNPRPTPETISRHYPSAYYTHHQRDDREAERIYGRPLQLVDRWCPSGSVLDIGAGDGAFLAVLRARGRSRLSGLEADPDAWRAATEGRGLPVTFGSFPEAAPPGSRFDAIVMLETIEHLHAPVAALRSVKELLAPGGKLILSTPNIDALEFRLLGAASVSLQVPRHLYFFTRGTLAAACEAAGLRVLHVETTAETDGLTRSLWLALRRRGRRAGSQAIGGATEARTYHARSWRRNLHGFLGKLLQPLGWLLRSSNMGPTLMLVAERPEHD